MKHRTTIMLPTELKARALKKARERGVSFGELVRESLAAMLSGYGEKKDSYLDDNAVFEGKTPADLAANHDHYLYDLEQ